MIFIKEPPILSIYCICAWMQEPLFSRQFCVAGVRTSDCATGSVIGRNTGIYVGGLPLGYTVVRNEAEKEDRAKVISTSFSGCMRDVKILQQLYPTERWLSLDWSNKTSHSHAFDNWQGCPRDDQLDWNIWLAARIFPHFLGNGLFYSLNSY